MFVWAPFGEAAQVVDDRRRVGVEDMRAVAMDQDSGCIVVIVGVARDVRPPVHQKHGSTDCREALREDGAGESGPDNHDVIAPVDTPHARRACARLPVVKPASAVARSISAVMRAQIPSQLADASSSSASASHACRLRDRCSEFDCRDEGRRGIGDGDGLDVAVVTNDVGDRRRDHRASAGEIFRRLGRADEACRVVAGEWHQRHVPPREVGRKLGVFFSAQVMDIRGPGQQARVDLGDRPDQHDLPVRAQRGEVGKQIDIQPLVDDAIEADARMRDGDLIRWFRKIVAGRAEMREVDAAGERMHVAVLMALHLVQAEPAGEHEVGAIHQCALAPRQRGVGAEESRQFVHAVIDQRTPCRQMVGERQRLRRVVP